MKILSYFGHPLSGMRSLIIENEDGELDQIDGDWRMINNIVNDLK